MCNLMMPLLKNPQNMQGPSHHLVTVSFYRGYVLPEVPQPVSGRAGSGALITSYASFLYWHSLCSGSGSMLFCVVLFTSPHVDWEVLWDKLMFCTAP